MREKAEIDQRGSFSQDELRKIAFPSGLAQGINAIVEQQMPHKIFLRDSIGTYQNYCFLNPPFGHFITPSSLLGATIHEVHSRANSRLLLQAISRVRKNQVQQTITLTFHRQRSLYQATVQCLPTANEQIVGLVRDTLQQGQSVLPSFVSSIPLGKSRDCEDMLTPREKTVFTHLNLQPSLPRPSQETESDPKKWMYTRQGLTNQAIAEELGISLRTVKEHVTNIYRKLHIMSRHHCGSSHLNRSSS